MAALPGRIHTIRDDETTPDDETHNRCTTCRVVKEWTAFREIRSKLKGTYRRRVCKACEREERKK
jgi:hypothetical protein